MLESGNPAIFASGVSVDPSYRGPGCVCKVLDLGGVWTLSPVKQVLEKRRLSPGEGKGQAEVPR